MKEIWVDASMGRGSKVSYNCTPSLTARTAFFYVQGVGHFRCGDGYYTRREGYRSYLMIYTLDGKGRALYRGKQYALDRGKLLLIDCYDYQEYFTEENGFWEIKWEHFNGCSSKEYFSLLYDNYGPVVEMPEGNSIAGHVDRITEIVKSGDVRMEIKASCIISTMLADILLAASEGKDAAFGEGGRDARIEAALDFADRYYGSRISAKDMARAACVSIYHFTRLFRKATGYSPYEYLLKHRINKSKDFLRTTDETVGEISRKVGFESASNFIRAFRDLEGMTPLRYRKYGAGAIIQAPPKK